MNLDELSIATSRAGALSNLILVTPQVNIGYQAQRDIGADDDQPQPEAFFFDYEGEQSVSLESDITDHYIEDNTTLQDQISLKPEKIATIGFVAELNDIIPSSLGPLKTATDKLTVISAYVPQLSIAAQVVQNEVKFLTSVATNVKNAAVQAWGGGDKNGIPKKTKQQIAYEKFYGYWKERRLFTIQTPWAIFNNVAILSIRAVQNEDSRMISEFEISFKKLNFASTGVNGTDLQDFLKRAGVQAASYTNHGNEPVGKFESLDLNRISG